MGGGNVWPFLQFIWNQWSNLHAYFTVIRCDVLCVTLIHSNLNIFAFHLTMYTTHYFLRWQWTLALHVNHPIWMNMFPRNYYTMQYRLTTVAVSLHHRNIYHSTVWWKHTCLCVARCSTQRPKEDHHTPIQCSQHILISNLWKTSASEWLKPSWAWIWFTCGCWKYVCLLWVYKVQCHTNQRRGPDT